MKLSVSCLTIFILVSGTLSCQSKFEEKDPVGEESNTAFKKEYSLKVQDVQQRLSKAQDLIDGLGIVLKKIKAPEMAQLTVSDILVQIMDSVKNSRVEAHSSKLVSEGEVFLTTMGLSKQCRKIRTQSIYIHENDRTEHYLLIQTCRTQGEFKRMAELIFSQEGQISVLVEKDLESIFPQVNFQQLLSAQGCQVEKNEETITHIQCEVSDLVLNDHERVKFKEVSYLAERNPVLTTNAVLYKNNVATFNLVLEIDQNGKTFSKAVPISTESGSAE